MHSCLAAHAYESSSRLESILHFLAVRGTGASVKCMTSGSTVTVGNHCAHELPPATPRISSDWLWNVGRYCFRSEVDSKGVACLGCIKSLRTVCRAAKNIAYVPKNVTIGPLRVASDLLWAACFSNPSGVWYLSAECRRNRL